MSRRTARRDRPTTRVRTRPPRPRLPHPPAHRPTPAPQSPPLHSTHPPPHLPPLPLPAPLPCGGPGSAGGGAGGPPCPRPPRRGEPVGAHRRPRTGRCQGEPRGGTGRRRAYGPVHAARACPTRPHTARP